MSQYCVSSSLTCVAGSILPDDSSLPVADDLTSPGGSSTGEYVKKIGGAWYYWRDNTGSWELLKTTGSSSLKEVNGQLYYWSDSADSWMRYTGSASEVLNFVPGTAGETRKVNGAWYYWDSSPGSWKTLTLGSNFMEMNGMLYYWSNGQWISTSSSSSSSGGISTSWMSAVPPSYGDVQKINGTWYYWTSLRGGSWQSLALSGELKESNGNLYYWNEGSGTWTMYTGSDADWEAISQSSAPETQMIDGKMYYWKSGGVPGTGSWEAMTFESDNKMKYIDGRWYEWDSLTDTWRYTEDQGTGNMELINGSWYVWTDGGYSYVENFWQSAGASFWKDWKVPCSPSMSHACVCLEYAHVCVCIHAPLPFLWCARVRIAMCL